MLLLGKVGMRERLLTLRWNLQAHLEGNTVLLAVGVHEREVMFPNPIAVKAGWDFEDEVTAIKVCCLHRLNPLGEFLSSEVLLKKLADT